MCSIPSYSRESLFNSRLCNSPGGNARFRLGTINAGFPSAASDYEERELDILDLVVPRPTSSYWIRVSGEFEANWYARHGESTDLQLVK